MRASLIQAFSSLSRGETVPFSRFPQEWLDEMLSEGGVTSIVRGSHKSLRVVSKAAFDVYLRSKGLQPDMLEETAALFASPPASRAQQEAVNCLKLNQGIFLRITILVSSNRIRSGCLPPKY